MKKILILVILSITVFSIGCTGNRDADIVGLEKHNRDNPSVSTEKQDIHIVEAYVTVIEKLYKEDIGLNSNIKYIAIDTSKMVNLTDEGKTELLKKIESYGFKVLDMTFEELEKEGYIKDLYFEEGILFKIEDKPIKNNSITMNISKWRSGRGAIGYDGLVIEYINDKWDTTKLGDAWIS
ncbi:hypothetical protein [Alkaliphilus sp. B6464]|uniref:hypothetical protein n=1 Tax=Alkaliphilus sp. B6464 TaxID=2731219 RepID=UPI001BAA6596|nr:hypothetical protein [Alkaliphilus sp. B6464]QUH18860.1 hypothetical protein HYG84_02320 [Alkaliphilus sp. B6464]